MDLEAQIYSHQERINDYFKSLQPLLIGADDVPSSIIELNTSARGDYVRTLLGNIPSTVTYSRLKWCKHIVYGSLRLWLKYIFLLVYSRWKRTRRYSIDRSILTSASHICVGHTALREKRFIAKDFIGFMSDHIKDAAVAVIALRLPHISWKIYLNGEDHIPGETYIRLSDVWIGWLDQLRLLWRLHNQGSNRIIAEEALRDFASGHAPHASIYTHAVHRLIEENAGVNAQIYLPLERHDWECLLLWRLKQENPGRKVSLVQNCSFSIQDANMYVSPFAPSYRQKMPDQIYVVDSHWQQRLMLMGMKSSYAIMRHHRFSETSEYIEFDPKVRRLLYLGSINPFKVQCDLDVLARLPHEWQIYVRLHPSASDVTIPDRFKSIRSLKGTFSYCVHADTSMVIFAKANMDRFIYLEHPNILNQNPLPITGREGANMTPEQFLSKLTI